MARIISIHSFRGGAGKSNIAANLAALFAPEGQRVGVVDTDLQSPGIHALFGLGLMPSYPSGVWSYVMACDEPLSITLDELARRYAERSLKLSYYTPEVHQASGVIPPALQ
jgi:Mrp family chromosome partitioning ATPase